MSRVKNVLIVISSWKRVTLKSSQNTPFCLTNWNYLPFASKSKTVSPQEGINLNIKVTKNESKCKCRGRDKKSGLIRHSLESFKQIQMNQKN